MKSQPMSRSRVLRAHEERCLPRPFLGLAAALLAVLLSGCFPMIERVKPETEGVAPFPPIDSNHDLLVGLAVSGGGSRAAVFAAGAMEGLASTRVAAGGDSRSLLELVTHVSSVSGGSLATAYFALEKPGREEPVFQGTALTPRYQSFFEKFEEAMQTNFEGPAALRQVLMFRAFNSTKAAYSFSEVWDEEFFRKRKFRDLYERERKGDSPRIILNGTQWNDGSRFLFTTLPSAMFVPDFARDFLRKVECSNLPPEYRQRLTKELRVAYDRFAPITLQNVPEASRGDWGDFRVSLAVAGSASVPGAIGPVTFVVGDDKIKHHIGDGGLFDNQGVESLTELYLHMLQAGSASPGPGKDCSAAQDQSVARPSGKRALIIAIDAAFPFAATKQGLDEAETALDVLKADPLRVQGMMEERALAYQRGLWAILRMEESRLVPGPDRFDIIRLRHTDARWDDEGRPFDALPKACKEQFSQDVTSEKINAYLGKIPTRLRLLDSCAGPLLIVAAHKVVQQHSGRIRQFIEQSPR